MVDEYTVDTPLECVEEAHGGHRIAQGNLGSELGVPGRGRLFRVSMEDMIKIHRLTRPSSVVDGAARMHGKLLVSINSRGIKRQRHTRRRSTDRSAVQWT